MEKTKFYDIIFGDEESVRWLMAYISVGYDDRTPLYEFLDHVRNGLVPDMDSNQVIETLIESIRVEFNA